MNTAETLSQYVPDLRPEPLEYLDPNQSWGTFSILTRQNSDFARQKSYPLHELESVIQECASKKADYWISQASFNAFNRRKVNLRHIGVSFVDLDYYNIPELANFEPEKVLHEYVFPLLQAKKMPLPSLVIDSGAGMQIKWFTERLPAKALPRWDRLQTELCEVLSELGADSNAKDASRVLRLQGTINQKTGLPVRVIWSDVDSACLPERFEFNDLCDRVLPYTQERLAQLRAEKAKRSQGTRFKVRQTSKSDVIKMLKSPFARTTENLNWHRLHDLKKLIELRGSIADGLREPMAFYLCNFYALRYAQSGLTDLNVWHEFYQLSRGAAPHWTHDHARSKVNNVFDLMKRQAAGEMKEWCGQKVPMLYVPRNDTIINLFKITDDEQRQLSTIISGSEKQRRNTVKQRERRGNGTMAEYQNGRSSGAEQRMREVIKLTSQGFKQAKIAEFLGISVNAVKSLKKRAKTAS